MKMVARLPEGVPTEFRRKLWLTLADKYLTNKGVDWKRAERTCFNEWSNPDDDELGLQIVRVSFSKPLTLCLHFFGSAEKARATRWSILSNVKSSKCKQILKCEIAGKRVFYSICHSFDRICIVQDAVCSVERTLTPTN